MSSRRAIARVAGIDRELHFEVHVENDKHVSERIASEGVWEPFETELIRRFVGPGDLVADCGANIGWYSIVTAALGARVVACEPMPANAELLRRNVAVNGFEDVIEVHQVGLGATPGRATLELSAANQGDHRMVAAASGRKATVEVDIVTLDSILAGRRPTVLKLDTQGSEVAILRGGRSAWTRPEPTADTSDSLDTSAPSTPVGTSAPVIVIEFWPYGLQQCGASVDELLAMFAELVDISHACFEVQEWNTSLTRRSLADLDRLAHEGGYSAEMKGFTNLLLVPLERLAVLADLI